MKIYSIGVAFFFLKDKLKGFSNLLSGGKESKKDLSLHCKEWSGSKQQSGPSLGNTKGCVSTTSTEGLINARVPWETGKQTSKPSLNSGEILKTATFHEMTRIIFLLWVLALCSQGEHLWNSTTPRTLSYLTGKKGLGWAQNVPQNNKTKQISTSSTTPGLVPSEEMEGLLMKQLCATGQRMV